MFRIKKEEDQRLQDLIRSQEAELREESPFVQISEQDLRAVAKDGPDAS